MSSDTLNYITDAEVNLFINDVFQEKLSYQAKGIYKSQTPAAVNDTLRCEVRTLNNGLTSARTVIPEPTEILEAKVYENAWVNSDGRTSPAVEFTITNSLGKVKYYEARVAIYSGHGFSINTYKFSDEFSLLLFSTEHETEPEIRKYIEFQLMSYGYSEFYFYILELRSVSESYYNYAQSVVLYEQGRYPSYDVGSIVPYNLYSNVDNGYGIFAGYSTQFSDTLQQAK